MNLLEKIKNQIEVLGLKFVYHDFLRANNELDTTSLPAVVCIRNPNSSLINAAGNYTEQTDFLLIFVDKTDFLLNSFENEEIIERMKRLAIKFLICARKNPDLQVITSNRIQKVYDYMDVNVTGCGISITIRETNGECCNYGEEVFCG